MVVAGFVIACLGLVVALLSAGWQVFAWVMDGRRVRVRLLHGVRSGGSVFSGAIGKDGRPNDLGVLLEQGVVGEEVIGVSVTNVGRAPVRIDSYGVQLVRGGFASQPVGSVMGPSLPFRLPPGETEAWYVAAGEARALVHAVKAIGREASREVRMTVQLGTGDTVRTRRSVTVDDGVNV